MKYKFFNWLKTALILTAAMTFLLSCQDDEDNNEGPDDEQTYSLNQVTESGISGDALFEKLSSGGTRITVNVTGSSAGETHPMHIHQNSASEGGPIAISLTPVNGSTGTSVTEVTEMDNGTAITYEQLLDFDGYINVHLSPTELGTIVAQGNIGQNAP